MNFFKIHQLLVETTLSARIQNALNKAKILTNTPLVIIVGKNRLKATYHPTLAMSTDLSGNLEITLNDRSTINAELIDAIESEGKVVYQKETSWWTDHSTSKLPDWMNQ